MEIVVPAFSKITRFAIEPHNRFREYSLIAAPQSCVISDDYRATTPILESAFNGSAAYVATNFVPRYRGENLYRYRARGRTRVKTIRDQWQIHTRSIDSYITGESIDLIPRQFLRQSS